MTGWQASDAVRREKPLSLALFLFLLERTVTLRALSHLSVELALVGEEAISEAIHDPLEAQPEENAGRHVEYGRLNTRLVSDPVPEFPPMSTSMVHPHVGVVIIADVLFSCERNQARSEESQSESVLAIREDPVDWHWCKRTPAALQTWLLAGQSVLLARRGERR